MKSRTLTRTLQQIAFNVREVNWPRRGGKKPPSEENVNPSLRPGASSATRGNFWKILCLRIPSVHYRFRFDWKMEIPGNQNQRDSDFNFDDRSLRTTAANGTAIWMFDENFRGRCISGDSFENCGIILITSVCENRSSDYRSGFLLDRITIGCCRCWTHSLRVFLSITVSADRIFY